MPRILLALPLLLLPAAAPAQEGPSFDCRYAATRTEIAICASPGLAQLERRMVRSYEALAGAIGEGEARRIADQLLARRQACEGDPRCIAERLAISMEVFDQRAGRRSRFARLEDILSGAEPAAPPVAAADPPAVAAAPLPAAPAPAAEPEPDLPLAAQAPWPAEPGAPDLSDALDGADLASSDGAAGAIPEPAADPAADPAAAAFDTPLSWAFMDLDRAQRAEIQERLARAGYLDGEATGAWTDATHAALERLAEEEGSGSFDLTTQTGAALLLDYVGSEAFATAFGVREAAANPAPAAAPAPEAADPLAGAEW